MIRLAAVLLLFLRCVHDPAWWWAEASNLRASSDAVVRFNLAHVFSFLCSISLGKSLLYSAAACLDATHTARYATLFLNKCILTYGIQLLLRPASIVENVYKATRAVLYDDDVLREFKSWCITYLAERMCLRIHGSSFT